MKPCNTNWVFAVDPGSHKVGYAIVYKDLTHGDMGIVPVDELKALIFKYFANAGVDDNPVLVIGDGTGSKGMCKEIQNMVSGKTYCLVNEENTTFAARKEFFKENPPRGLMRFLPSGLWLPPRPIDDYAAWLIGVKYFSSHN